MGADLRRLGLVAGAVSLALVLVVYFGPWSATRGGGAALEGAIVAGPHAGDRINADTTHGRVVLVDFWASWCAPCRDSVPTLNRLAARYGEREVDIYGVNVERRLVPRELGGHHREMGMHYPTLHDRDGAMKRAFGIRGLPTVVVLGRDGQVRTRFVGRLDEAALAEAIDEALAAAPPSAS